MLAAVQQSEAKSNRLWLLIALGLGGAVGFALPFLIESALELPFLFLAIFVVAGIFAMPRTRSFSDRLCWVLFLSFVALFSIYPSYISMRLPGLPWISPVRVLLVLLLATWLYALHMSSTMRDRIAAFIADNRAFFILFGMYLAAQVLSIPTAYSAPQAVTKFVLFQLQWTFPFFAALTLVNTPERAQTLVRLLVFCAFLQCLIGFAEARQERLIWLDYLPPGFGADSEFLTRILQGAFRGDGYRVQGSFSVSLSYAEYLVLMLPFAIYLAAEGRSKLMRIFGAGVAVAIIPAQFLSGSRLGSVGVAVVLTMGFVIVALRHWQRNRRSMTGTLMLIVLPFILVAMAGVYFSSGRLQTMTIGGGQHQASTDGRTAQAVMAVPKVAARPLFGHGIGLAGEALGFRNLGGTLTIDSYVLSVIIEVGIVGFIGYFGMFIVALVTALRCYMQARDGPGRLAGAVALMLTAFLVTKIVLSQTETHVLAFLGLALALIAKQFAAGASPAASPLASHQSAPQRRKAGRARRYGEVGQDSIGQAAGAALPAQGGR